MTITYISFWLFLSEKKLIYYKPNKESPLYFKIVSVIPEKSQSYRVSWQYYSRSPKNIASKLAFNVGLSSVRQQNAILMAFCWWANDDPIFVVFGSSLPSSAKNIVFRVGHPLTKLSGSAHGR